MIQPEYVQRDHRMYLFFLLPLVVFIPSFLFLFVPFLCLALFLGYLSSHTLFFDIAPSINRITYCLSEVLVTLASVPELFDWTKGKMGPFEFDEAESVLSLAHQT